MKKSALLIGNGLNRVSAETAWTDLLKEVQSALGIKASTGYTNYPLEFERIDQAALAQRDGTIASAKREIAKRVPTICDYSLLREYTDLPVDALLTTNYDYNLEKAIYKGYSRRTERSSTKETKHSIYRYTTVGDRRVWHIHGEAQCPHSICMGYEQYCSHLARLHTLLTQPKQGFSHRPYLDHVLLHNDDTNPPWPVLFFTHNIYIVGLQLSLMEIDLWWLLSYRKRLMLQKSSLSICNEIHFFFKETETTNEQCLLLESMGVTLHPVRLKDNNWRALYEDIARSIKELLKTGR